MNIEMANKYTRSLDLVAVGNSRRMGKRIVNAPPILGDTTERTLTLQFRPQILDWAVTISRDNKMNSSRAKLLSINTQTIGNYMKIKIGKV
jgi:hypothetical protein